MTPAAQPASEGRSEAERECREKAARVLPAASFADLPLTAVGGADLYQLGLGGNGLSDLRKYLGLMADRVCALRGIWANSKSFLLAPGSRADRVGQQATQRTASTGMSGRIPISSEKVR